MVLRRAVALLAWLAAAAGLGAVAQAATPETVYLPSADGQTELVGYLFVPPHASGGGARHPAVVLLHGRAGPYSSRVNAGCTTVARGTASPCGAGSLTQRHMSWAAFWSERGYVTLLVDSFGPRGRGHGFGRGTHDDPEREAVNEKTVRPLDAEGGLAWLAARPDVDPQRILLQGWSNGGSTVLNTLQRQATVRHGGPRFAAALAFYPGCGPQALLARKLTLDAPLLMLLASEDEEVSPKICQDVAARTPGNPKVIVYEGATHDFDDPGKSRQSVAGNRRARDDAFSQAAAAFGTTR